MLAAIRGLQYAAEILAFTPPEEHYEVTLISDSEIVLNWANGKYRFKQLQKMHMYDQLISLVKKMQVKTQWIRSHSGSKWNERCDKLANLARKGITTEGVDENAPKPDTNIGNKKNGVICIWYDGVLKVVDLEIGCVEKYDRQLHGKRGSVIEIRGSKQ